MASGKDSSGGRKIPLPTRGQLLTRLIRDRGKAEAYASDPTKTGHLVTTGLAKAAKHKGALARVWSDLTALFRLLAAWAKGRYTQAPWRTIVLAIGAIVYFVNPIDLIPDFIPAAGFVDDAAVLTLVFRAIRGDVEKFLLWERRQTTKTKRAKLPTKGEAKAKVIAGAKTSPPKNSPGPAATPKR